MTKLLGLTSSEVIRGDQRQSEAMSVPHDGVVRARDGEDDSACIELFGEAIRGN